MNTALTTLVAFGCIIGVVLLGLGLRRFLPEDHLSADSRDVVKLAMGLVATMAALVLGLLVRSAKSDFDTKRSEVTQMAGKVAFLDRLTGQKPPTRVPSFMTPWRRLPSKCGLDELACRLTSLPTDNQAMQLMMQSSVFLCAMRSRGTSKLKQRPLPSTRSLLVAQSVASVSMAMLIILISWLVVIFLGFSVLALPNATAIVALLLSALAVSGAIFLILELDQPFGAD